MRVVIARTRSTRGNLVVQSIDYIVGTPVLGCPLIMRLITGHPGRGVPTNTLTINRRGRVPCPAGGGKHPIQIAHHKQKPALDAPVFILGRPEVAPYTSGNRELFPVFLSFLEILILVGVVSTILNLHKGDIQTHTQISISGIHIKGEGFQVRHLTYKGKIREDISANQSQVL